ncbi:U32 family peptidase [Lentisphaera marina]|uniref:peptidase U32 family protein n=1 Tax=Lentisphaera marina TaxID=1111041 RepID=UPI0023652EC6|nr:peptidase U32 family protein [Lentisphaera marina]MDD7984070.1 U32 family peptidase [Lentisphaera marina]
MKFHNVELLAPAGCYASLNAAVQNGADAVYFGLAQLNMRARARRSFHTEDLPEIIRICQEAGVKSYLTLNTLLYEHDLKLCRKMLETAKAEGVSGVILSDMAAVQMANELDIEVHLSTQLSISNYESLKFYAPYCDRVVLARELNLTMISSIYEKIQRETLLGRNGKEMEIEAFAHGALCIAVSGRCGMSLYTSNASANRGACEQNCRKEYTVTDSEGKQLKVDNNFIMSPNDINTIDFVDQLLESGVRVFKIEGRGRSPEYVATVIKAYRAAIDAVQDGTYGAEFVKNLMPELEKVYNRGFSSGYYLGREQGWAEADGNKSPYRKVYIGPIKHYFSKAGIAEVESCAGSLRVGDEYVVVGKTTGAVQGVISEMRSSQNGEMVATESVVKGELFTFPNTEKIRPSDKLYKLEKIDAKA